MIVWIATFVLSTRGNGAAQAPETPTHFIEIHTVLFPSIFGVSFVSHCLHSASVWYTILSAHTFSICLNQNRCAHNKWKWITEQTKGERCHTRFVLELGLLYFLVKNSIWIFHFEVKSNPYQFPSDRQQSNGYLSYRKYCRNSSAFNLAKG